MRFPVSLFVEGDDQIGPFGYLHHVEGVRDDIELRAWNQTVFPNRLGSPLLPAEDRETLITSYLSTLDAPAFLIPRYIEKKLVED